LIAVIVGGFDGARHARDLRITEQETDGGSFSIAGEWGIRDKHPREDGRMTHLADLTARPEVSKGIAWMT
jgi:hypothetical protein